jgi:hypothetical protein
MFIVQFFSKTYFTNGKNDIYEEEDLYNKTKNKKEEQTTSQVTQNNKETSTFKIVGIVLLSIVGIFYFLYQLGKHGIRKQNEETLNINIDVCENTINQIKEKIGKSQDPTEKDKLTAYKKDLEKILPEFYALKNTINTTNIFLLSGTTLVETAQKNNNIVNEKLNPLLTEIQKSIII